MCREGQHPSLRPCTSLPGSLDSLEPQSPMGGSQVPTGFRGSLNPVADFDHTGPTLGGQSLAPGAKKTPILNLTQSICTCRAFFRSKVPLGTRTPSKERALPASTAPGVSRAGTECARWMSVPESQTLLSVRTDAQRSSRRIQRGGGRLQAGLAAARRRPECGPHTGPPYMPSYREGHCPGRVHVVAGLQSTGEWAGGRNPS